MHENHFDALREMTAGIQFRAIQRLRRSHKSTIKEGTGVMLKN